MTEKWRQLRERVEERLLETQQILRITNGAVMDGKNAAYREVKEWMDELEERGDASPEGRKP